MHRMPQGDSHKLVDIIRSLAHISFAYKLQAFYRQALLMII